MNTSIKKYHNRDFGLTSFHLKLIAMGTMLLDHIGVSIVGYTPGVSDTSSFLYFLYWILRIIGRFAFPLYLFMLIEGARHTHNKLFYALRLLIFGFLSEIPFDLCCSHTLIDWDYQNVMFTLFFSLLAIIGYMYIDEHGLAKFPPKLIKGLYIVLPGIYFSYRLLIFFTKETSIKINKYILWFIIWVFCEILIIYTINYIARKKGDVTALSVCAVIIILALAMGLADLCKTDYSSAGVLAASLMYMFRKRRPQDMVAGCFVLAALSNPIELSAFAMIPVITNYNGKKGYKLSFLLYFFYPCHLLFLAFAAKYLGIF